MSESSNYLYDIALSMTPGIGPIHAKRLIKHCGNAESVFREKPGILQKIKNIGPIKVNALGKEAIVKAENELAFMENNNIQLLHYQSSVYPKRLKIIDDAPIILYYKGNKSLETARSLAFVGTRTPSPLGLHHTGEMILSCRQFDVQIVSGLASGIDTKAHSSALEYEMETIAVLGHGLDKIYPQNNLNLAKRIVDSGGLLTEFPSNTKPDRENFPSRNRIIAGLSDALIVIESRRSGGSMISAEFANMYNKDVFAMPGRIDDERSKGCNFLIKSHRANLLEDAKDIAYIMNWGKHSTKKQIQRSLDFSLDKDEKLMVELLKENQSLNFDEIAIKSGLNLNQLAKTLLELEMKGLILALPGKRFSSIN
jgi:DNA processing protein